MPGENFPGDRIVSLVDELEGLIEEAKPPFGKNAQFKVCLLYTSDAADEL